MSDFVFDLDDLDPNEFSGEKGATSYNASAMPSWEQPDDRYQMDRVSLIQVKGKWPTLGQNVEGGGVFRITSVGQDGQPVVYATEELFAVPVDQLTQWVGKERLGARQAWPFDADGKRSAGSEDAKGPLCKSLNGQSPTARYIGTPYQLPHFYENGGMVGVIGSSQLYPPNVLQAWLEERRTNPDAQMPVNFQMNDLENMCRLCPLSQWVKKPDGGSHRLCNSGFNYIFWLPPQRVYIPTTNKNGMFKFDGKEVMYPGGLVMFQAQSTTVHLVLAQNPSTRSRTMTGQGEATKGIFDIVGTNGVAEVVVTPEQMVKMQPRPTITGYTVADGTAVRAHAVDTINALKEGHAVNVTVQVPRFSYAPDGLPQYVGTHTTVHPIRFEIRASAGKYSNLVPFIKVDETITLTEQEVQDWTAAISLYHDEDLRNLLMGFGDTAKTRLEEKIALLSAPSTPTYQISAPSSDTDSPKFLSMDSDDDLL